MREKGIINQLEQIKERLNNATKGPWRTAKDGIGAVVSDYPVPEINGSEAVEYYGGHLIGESISTDNREFIAHSWDDIKYLLDIVRQVVDHKDKSAPICDILAERQRQNEKWGLQNHELPVWMAILGEEFGELCEAVNETYFDNGAAAKRKGGYENLYTEATHVAAVAMQIMEFLNRTYPQGEES